MYYPVQVADRTDNGAFAVVFIGDGSITSAQIDLSAAPFNFSFAKGKFPVGLTRLKSEIFGGNPYLGTYTVAVVPGTSLLNFTFSPALSQGLELQIHFILTWQ